MAELSSEQAAAAEKIRSIVKLIQQNNFEQLDKKAEWLRLLEDYECWEPLFKLLENNISDPKSRSIENYVCLARIQSQNLENIFAAAEICAQLVKTFQISYEQFREDVIDHIVEPENWQAEATILQAVVDEFTNKNDIIKCLERLSLIYEKKLPNDQQLDQVYRKLLSIDQTNLKALRYFKLVFTQSFEWEEVVKILKKLLQSPAHPIDIFRFAQELAAVYLYQLDCPKDAINIINRYCIDSPLDTSTIHFDAYQRLGDISGCINVLQRLLKDLNDDKNKAIIHFKIAELQLNSAHKSDALKNYEKAIHYQKFFLEAIERIIELNLETKNWEQINFYLDYIYSFIGDHNLKEKLIEVKKRLLDSLRHV